MQLAITTDGLVHFCHNLNVPHPIGNIGLSRIVSGSVLDINCTVCLNNAPYVLLGTLNNYIPFDIMPEVRFFGYGNLAGDTQLTMPTHVLVTYNGRPEVSTFAMNYDEAHNQVYVVYLRGITFVLPSI